MKNKNTQLLVGAVVCVLVLGGFFFLNQKKAIEEYKSIVEGGSIRNSDVLVTMPKENEDIISPVEVSGMIRGNWFFEGSFPIRVYDGDGDLLGEGLAGSKESWMTEDIIPFFAEISFANPGNGLGWIRLQKDNPSGLSEFDASHDIPVRFVPDRMQIKVYFHNKEKSNDPNFIDCGKVFPVLRMIEKTQAVARESMNQLLQGPTEQEKSDGYFTTIPPREGFNQIVGLKDIKIEDGIATVDFNSNLTQGGSCALSAVLSQVRETLLQFPTVSSVKVLVNGSGEWAENP